MARMKTWQLVAAGILISAVGLTVAAMSSSRMISSLGALVATWGGVPFGMALRQAVDQVDAEAAARGVTGPVFPRSDATKGSATAPCRRENP